MTPPRTTVYTETGRALSFDHDEVRAMRCAVELRAAKMELSLGAYLGEWVPRYLLPNESERTCAALVRMIFDDVPMKKGA